MSVNGDVIDCSKIDYFQLKLKLGSIFCLLVFLSL